MNRAHSVLAPHFWNCLRPPNH